MQRLRNVVWAVFRKLGHRLSELFEAAVLLPILRCSAIYDRVVHLHEVAVSFWSRQAVTSFFLCLHSAL